MPRSLYNHELPLIRKLLVDSGLQIENALVEEMDDGGMGSLLFWNNMAEDRRFGKTLSTAEFKDEDGISVIASINLDQFDDLFELDVWKVDSSPIIKWPIEEDINILDENNLCRIKHQRLNNIWLFLASIIGLYLGQIYGPANTLPNPVSVDEHYFNVWHSHFLYLGLITGLFACIVGFVTKSSYKTIIFVLIISGLVFNTFSQSGEPDFLDFYISGLIEFMLPYLVGCIAMIIIYRLIQIALNHFQLRI